MATSQKFDQEYWRATPPREDARAGEDVTCGQCGAEIVLGGRFCHVCGAGRDAAPERRSAAPLSRYLDFHLIKDSLGLSVGSLVALIVGVACVVAAALTGVMYTADTVLDWQAVQMWRIQWLLAAGVAFIAGILLKRS